MVRLFISLDYYENGLFVRLLCFCRFFAARGVGLAVVQIGKVVGATVIVVARWSVGMRLRRVQRRWKIRFVKMNGHRGCRRGLVGRATGGGDMATNWLECRVIAANGGGGGGGVRVMVGIDGGATSS
ncbi:hypothetical protein Tco_1135120 [Tanacetum coccineum]